MTTATIRGYREFGYIEKSKPAEPAKTGMTVIEDKLPYEQGGFRSGARIDAMQVQFMLEAKTIALGSLFRYRRKLYRVALDMKGHYVLSPVVETWEI